MNKIQITVDKLKELKPSEIIRNEEVRARFIQIYDTLWGQGTGEAAYEREANYFNAQLREKPELKNATHFSLFTSFIDLAVCGLSLEPGARALCYIIPRSTNIGKDAQGKNIYEKRAKLTISGYGELVLRARAGQIRHADNPVLVYEEDNFSVSDTDGRKTVSYTCNYPHKSNRIVAAYLRITRADGSIDYAVMLEEDWKRLEGYSEEANKYWDESKREYVKKANALYKSNGGSIDTGFLCAKLIKHAFSTYPKVRIGKAELESQIDEEQRQQDIEQFYNVEEAQQEAKPFGNPTDTSAGVVVDPQQSPEQTNAAGTDDGTF